MNKAQKQTLTLHVMECVLNNEGQKFNSLDELKSHVKSEFERVANHSYNLKKIPNKSERFSDYLNGIPFCFYFYYEDINEFLNKEMKYKTLYSDTINNRKYHYLIYSLIFS